VIGDSEFAALMVCAFALYALAIVWVAFTPLRWAQPAGELSPGEAREAA
jgi:hypothetical protein